MQKNIKFNKLFFEEDKKKKIKFELNMVDKLDENIFKSLASNGVVILENALPDEEREKIKNDFDELKERTI